MHQRFWLFSVGLAIAVVAGARAKSEGHTFYHENVLGTSLELHVDSPSLESDHQAEAAVLREIDRLSGILSSYSDTSELAGFLDGPRTTREASRELIEVFEACDHWRAVSGGAFNPAAEHLSRLWVDSAQRNRLPSASELKEAVRLVESEAWKIDVDRKTVTRRSDVPITLNAIAKGYIIDRACRAALRENPAVTGLLLDIGGDLRVWGDAARSIGVADPSSPADNAAPLSWINLRNAAVATSGNYARGFDIDGVHYSHIVDPRNGKPVDEVTSATVIAPRAQEADVLATILNVLEPREGILLANRLDDTECLIVTKGGEVLTSAGWSEHAARPSERLARLARFAGEPQAPKAPPEGSVWAEGLELFVDFEISRIRSYRYNRPYVAVWIEDAEGKPIRTLCLWMLRRDTRWFPDLRRYYSLHRGQWQLVRTVTRSSRPPGRYRLRWDGLANDWQYAPPGKYTVFMEASREHGSYQLMRQEIEIGKEPFALEMKGNIEISRASVEFHNPEKVKEEEAKKAAEAKEAAEAKKEAEAEKEPTT
jgi:thiamine biosynthesis lipoprotein